MGRDESAKGWDESAARAGRPEPFQSLSQTKNRNHFMSTATTTSHDTGQHTLSRTTTQPITNPATQTSPSAAQRLRTTMAAVKLSFTWLGVRKTLAPEQRTTAARAFHADGELLSARRCQLDRRRDQEVGNGDGSDFCCGAVHGRDWNSLPSPIIPPDYPVIERVVPEGQA
jgi:hypothetical protein